jgi:hypothetical protein
MKERASVKRYGGQEKKDFLTQSLEAQAKYPDSVSDRMVLMYNMENIVAGSDTTGISLRSVSKTPKEIAW